MFDSRLPVNTDWSEINDFLRTTVFYKQLLLDHWRESEAFTVYPVSDSSVDCLKCLHEDLVNCYRSAFAFDEKGNEDRNKEYHLLRENLFLKYDKIDPDILKKIFCSYLQEDR